MIRGRRKEQPAIRPLSRPAVVLLHSSASSARQWQSLARLLEPGFRVLAIDLHGHGARPGWSGATPLSLADEVALVRPLLEEAGGAHLVGHSYGAAVALKAATQHPDLVHSLVAYEPVLPRLLRDDAASSQPAQEFLAVGEFIRDRLLQGDTVAAARRFIDFWTGASAWDAMPPGRQQAVAACMPALSTTSPTAKGATRRWNSVDDFVREVADSRIYAGIHYRSATETGAAMGQRIGEVAAAKLLGAENLASAAAAAPSPLAKADAGQ